MPAGEGFVRRVTLDNLERFAPLLRWRLPTDSDQSENEEDVRDPDEANEEFLADPEVAAVEELFQGDRIRVTISHRRPRRTREQRRRGEASEELVSEVVGSGGSERGGLLWRKLTLPASDVQRQPGNPTGGVRLSQARFRNQRGEVIDQTRYFREEVFGNLDWEIRQEEPFREDARAEFEVTLQGTNYGRQEMRISHKPSGEASQGNYTTMLHWGGLGDIVRDLDLRGLTLSIYGPPPGDTEPYFLDVS